MKSAPVGYAGTPLTKKLGITDGMNVFAKYAPEGYVSWLVPLPLGVHFQPKIEKSTGLLHLFVEKRADLARELTEARKKLPVDSVVWVSWPKKSSKRATDITEDTIREVALPLGFVDVKVCAVSEIWSGLKLVVRKELR
jgi:hypothetical protein